jgi:hypothetical protein
MIHENKRPVGPLDSFAAKSPLSALLFGPPGTSKTEVTKVVADELQWPRIEINPSDFVKSGMERVYLTAGEIFNDLMDLWGVVVFFDEMDALTQTRSGERLDTPTQFLTTSMLPHLTALHDRGKIVFFMATNFQGKFDPAIKRAGRFDLLLCMGPPLLDEKLTNDLSRYFKVAPTQDDLKTAEAAIRRHLATDPVCEIQLGLFTYGEFKTFIKSFGSHDKFATALSNLSSKEFCDRLMDFAQHVTLRLSDLNSSAFEQKSMRACDKVQAGTLSSIEKTDQGKTEIVKYLSDRRASKRQF